jgi:hypothetical protein
MAPDSERYLDRPHEPKVPIRELKTSFITFTYFYRVPHGLFKAAIGDENGIGCRRSRA